MQSPVPATILALELSTAWRSINPDGDVSEANRVASVTATRVVSVAIAVRRLVEHSCNVELTPRQEKRLESLRKRADSLLQPYGLELANPWGLCFYAVPIGHVGSSQTGCTFLA